MKTSRYILLSLVFINVGCKNILTDLNQSQVTGLLSASFRTLNPINSSNQSSYLIQGYCGKKGSTIFIEPGVGSTACINGRFSYTADMSGFPEGALNLSLNATFGSEVLNNADAATPLKDTVPPFGSGITFNRDDDTMTYQIDGDCDEEGSTIRVQYMSLSRTTTCSGGAYSFNLNLSSFFPQSAALPSEIVTSEHPIDATDEFTDDPNERYLATYSKSYQNPSFQFTFTDAANNTVTNNWPIELSQSLGVDNFRMKFGLAGTTDCNVTTDYDPTVHNLNSIVTFSKAGFVVGDTIKHCALFTNSFGNTVIKEETWVMAAYPRVNNFSCLAAGGPGTLPPGALACYGLLDYGNAFGNDPDPCPDIFSPPSIGCTLAATQCASGTATATAFYEYHGGAPNLPITDPSISSAAPRFGSYIDLVWRGVIRMWDYTCN